MKSRATRIFLILWCIVVMLSLYNVKHPSKTMNTIYIVSFVAVFVISIIYLYLTSIKKRRPPKEK